MNTSKAPLIILTCTAVAIGAILALGNPHSTSWPLKCPLFHLTGLQCPLCGTQRAVHELLHGNIGEAWAMNPGFILLSPYLCILLLGQISPSLRRENRLVALCYSNGVALTVIALALVWGVVRNIL